MGYKLMSIIGITMIFFILISCEDEKEEIIVTLIQVSPSSAIIEIGQTKQFTATVRDQNGNVMDNISVTWFSDNDSVATVDEDGIATGVSEGNAAIFAMAEYIIGGAGLIVLPEEVHPLVDTWDMTNMEQFSLYTVADTIFVIGMLPGDTLGAGAMTWEEFSALGVSATLELKEDNTYRLSGNFPIFNDTLGFTPSVFPLEDQGTWTAPEPLSTLLLDGGIYDIPPSGEPGDIAVDDLDDPTTLSISYSEIEEDTVVLLIDISDPPDGIPDMFLPDIPINEASSTTLGFTKQ